MCSLWAVASPASSDARASGFIMAVKRLTCSILQRHDVDVHSGSSGTEDFRLQGYRTMKPFAVPEFVMTIFVARQ